MLLWLIVILAVVLVDQATKILVVAFLDKEEPLVIINNIFRFTYVENRGAAFGMLSDNRWVFMIISSIAIIAILIYMWRAKIPSKLANAGLALIVGGGIGNMIDRIFRFGTDASGEKYYYVVDFIDFYAFPNVWMWVFNVADACVCIGAAIMLFWCVKEIVKDFKLEKQKKAALSESAESEDNNQNEQQD